MDKAKSIELLNNAISEEMTAVHQYMFFHFHCDDQGYDLLAGLFRKTAIEEMMHIEKLAERVLFLKGEIKMEASEPVQNITTVKEMLDYAAESEDKAVVMYNDYATKSSANSDSNTKKVFEELIMDEERHFDQFDTEMENMVKFGDNYLAIQSIERSKVVSAGMPGIAGGPVA